MGDRATGREGLGLWGSPEVHLFSLPQDAYSKRFISVACFSRVAAIGDQKFEVITNNRTFAFRAESDGTEWGRREHWKFGWISGEENQGTSNPDRS